MNGVLQDLRVGVRMLARTPGLVFIAVLTLSIGIGANVAIFSFVDGIWLRPLLVREPDRIVSIFTSGRTADGTTFEDGDNSYPDYMDLKSQTKSLSGIAMIDRRGALLYDHGEAKAVSSAVVSDNFFDVMQVTPALGRTFTEAETSSPGTREVLLSYPFWKRQFQGDRSLIGRTIVVNSQEVAVIGVLPRGFRENVNILFDLWMPVSTRQQITGEVYSHNARDSRSYELYARLKDGVTPAQANTELASIAASLAQAYPATNRGTKMSAIPESQAHRGGMGMISLMLLTITGLVLFIACANVATLLVARAESRQHEIATRVALGASRWRIARQMIAESAIIAALSTAGALLFAHLIDSLFPTLVPEMLVSSVGDPYINLRTFGFAMLVGLVSVFLFGLLPSRQASRVSPAQELKQAGSSRSSRAIGRNVLVVLQVAVSLVMVVAAGLLVRTVQKIAATDPGFNAHQNMLVMNLIPGLSKAGPEANVNYVKEARRRIEELPGVQGTAAGMRIPFGDSGSGFTHKVFLPNMAAGSETDGVPINADPISDSFFEVLGTRLIRGRTINAHDVETGARVLVVNQLMARRFWPNAAPLGQRLTLDKPNGDVYEVVGVVENGIYARFGEDPKPYMFTPMTANDYGELDFVVKSSVAPEAITPSVRRILQDLNKDVPVIRMRSLRGHMREVMAEQRFVSGMVAVLGSLGLLLAAVGLYGLMSFLVGRRTQEIGVRLALGAQRSNIFRLVIRRALVLTGIGIALGIGASVLATQVLRDLLFGVTPTDISSFMAAMLVLAVVACGAALVPTLRATRIDPLAALRYE
jgi:putative ABC transport system permease protein